MSYFLSNNGSPVNGCDVSGWNGPPASLVPSRDLETVGVQLVGVRCAKLAGTHITGGVDDMFKLNRQLARTARWAAYYLWLSPATIISTMATQVDLLLRAVGALRQGECVYLDWEDTAVTRSMAEDAMAILDAELPGRWLTYVNDANPDMIGWLNDAKLNGWPVWHPDYSPNGLTQARKFKAAVWQVGTARLPWWSTEVPADYVLRPDVLDKLTGQ